MESGHDGISLQEIQREQDSIDRLIDSLLNSASAASLHGPLSAENKEINTPVVKSPSQAKRGRGRPPRLNLNSTSSPVTRTAGSGPSLDGIVECLNKLNSQNKKLLECVQSLSANVTNIANKECNCAEAGRADQVLKDQKPINIAITDRLEKIEQNLNSNVLICRGPGVGELVSEVKTGSTVNYEGLKGNLCRAICGDDVTGIDIGNLQLTLFGHEKKALKIDCANSSSKVHIVKQARQKKPSGIYISEFLTKTNLKIHANLRKLKKLHPRKIKSVYTKDGNVFYRLHDVDRAVLVRSVQEVENIFGDTPSNVEES